MQIIFIESIKIKLQTLLPLQVRIPGTKQSNVPRTNVEQRGIRETTCKIDYQVTDYRHSQSV